MTKTKIVQKVKNQPPVEPQIHKPNLWTTPDNFLIGEQRVFYPDWTNQPPTAPPIITLDNKQILTQGNYISIISRPGTGKSSICEAIAANAINPNCDALGFKVSLNKRDRVLYIDNERTPQDTWSSWERTLTRANIQKPDADIRLIFANLKMMARTERMEYVDKMLKSNIDIGLIMFDGGAGMVVDTNSIQETILFTDWINAINPLIGKLLTLHTNPTDYKPRGHLGSEYTREAECVLLIRKVDNTIREITTNFEHGKVRNDDDQITTFFQWGASHKMFISSDYSAPAPREQEKTQAFIELANEMFSGKTQVTYRYMVEFIIEKNKVGEPRAKQIIGQMTGKMIEKIETNVWQLKKQSV